MLDSDRRERGAVLRIKKPPGAWIKLAEGGLVRNVNAVLLDDGMPREEFEQDHRVLSGKNELVLGGGSLPARECADARRKNGLSAVKNRSLS